MRKKEDDLKIYSLNHPLHLTEWRALLSDKYLHSLPFNLTLTDDLKEAQVVAWDGAVSPKLQRLLPLIESELRKGKVLLLMGEAQTLFQSHPVVKLFSAPDIETVQLTGWSVLPEEMLMALESCHKKIKHV